MKKRNIFIVTVLLSFAFISCSDNFLDVTPKNALSDETFWQTEEDAELALAGVYENWDTWSNGIYFAGISDNAFYPGWSHYIDGTATPTNLTESYGGESYSGSWFEYQRIRKNNNLLEKIEEVEMDEARK